MSAAADLSASVRFRAGIGGEPIVQETRASAAHAFQPSAWGAWVVGDAAHPVAGDHYGLSVNVGVGCCAAIKSHSPTVARPGARRSRWPDAVPGSSTSVSVTVGSDAMLTWRMEPGVATDGCEHLTDVSVSLAASARLLWRDEFLVDRRSDATPGTWTSRIRVTRDSWPVVCNELAVGPASPLWESPAVLEGARAVSIMVIVDPGAPADGWAGARATVASATGVALPLTGPGLRMMAWGDDLLDCRAAIEKMVPAAGLPEWAVSRWRNGRPLDVVG